jgi:hypothetical protein
MIFKIKSLQIRIRDFHGQGLIFTIHFKQKLIFNMTLSPRPFPQSMKLKHEWFGRRIRWQVQ